MCDKCKAIEADTAKPRMYEATYNLAAILATISAFHLQPTTELGTALRAAADVSDTFLKDPVGFDPSTVEDYLLAVDPTLKTHPGQTELTMSSYKTLREDSAKRKENGINDADIAAAFASLKATATTH